MFYSRPKIEPLGWDLVELPVWDGCKHFDGLTSDRRPIDFHFSGGWLTVERGAVDAPIDGGPMEEVLSVPISPFGTMDIYPEQICDILGITVNGRKVDISQIQAPARGFDWSGDTTYWESTHLMHYSHDAETFVRELCKAFPDCVLVQPSWHIGHGNLTCRQIKFMMDTDEIVVAGMNYNHARLEKMLADEVVSTPEYEQVFAYTIDFTRRDRSYEDVTGKKYIDSNGAAKLDLDYSVQPHRRYMIRTQYFTEDLHAQYIMRTLLSLIDSYFCRGYQIVNLQTGEAIGEDLKDEYDAKSYSKTLRDHCLRSRKQYLTVGVSGMYEDRVPNTKEPVFFGVRPLEGSKTAGG